MQIYSIGNLLNFTVRKENEHIFWFLFTFPVLENVLKSITNKIGCGLIPGSYYRGETDARTGKAKPFPKMCCLVDILFVVFAQAQIESEIVEHLIAHVHQNI